MILTRLEDIGRRKVRVYFDHSPFCVLSINEVYRLGLKEDEEVEEDTFVELHERLLLRGKRKALDLLKYQDRTVKELRDRLLRIEYPEHIVDKIMEYVDSYGYLDDERYARNFMLYRGEGKSRLQVKQKLLQKGVSKELIDQVWEEFDYDEEEALEELVKKRIRQKGPITQDNFQKNYGFFARKGYPSNLIFQLLNKYKESQE